MQKKYLLIPHKAFSVQIYQRQGVHASINVQVDLANKK